MSDENLPGPETIVARANELIDANNPRAAIELINDFLITNEGPPPKGLHLTRGLAHLKDDVPSVAMHGFAAEMYLDPDNQIARDQQAALFAKLYPHGSSDPALRKWNTGLSQEAIEFLNWAAQRYTYRGVPMVKNCFDLALYPMLLQEIRPATIIEIGTLYGGSAAWLSDLTGVFGLQTQIYSIDVHGMPLLQPQRVTFMRGDGRALEKTLSPDFLAGLPRPLLVIEDADHEAVTTLAVLNFFHPILRSGEYILIEDGISVPGPVQGLKAFFAAHGHEYEIDARFCDYFGSNVTWCLNGFLRKK